MVAWFDARIVQYVEERSHASPAFSPTCLGQLWRLLLRRAQDVVGRGKDGSGDGEVARGVESSSCLLERGMMPLPLLDDVMGFDATEALRVRRQLQQERVVRACASDEIIMDMATA